MPMIDKVKRFLFGKEDTEPDTVEKVARDACMALCIAAIDDPSVMHEAKVIRKRMRALGVKAYD